MRAAAVANLFYYYYILCAKRYANHSDTFPVGRVTALFKKIITWLKHHYSRGSKVYKLLHLYVCLKQFIRIEETVPYGEDKFH